MREVYLILFAISTLPSSITSLIFTQSCFTASPAYTTIPSDVTSTSTGINTFSQNIVMDNEGTTVTLNSGDKVKAKVVVDGTGAESCLTLRSREGEGYQIGEGSCRRKVFFRSIKTPNPSPSLSL